MPFKIKYNGLKLKVRDMLEIETIQKKTLLRVGNIYVPSKCVGDQISDHKGRHYVLVLSEFFEGTSV